MFSVSQPLEPNLQRCEPGVLAGNGQRLSVFLSVLEQISLIVFERCSRDLCRLGGSIPSAPFQKHLHVNAANSQSARAEALHRKMLQILIQQQSKGSSG